MNKNKINIIFITSNLLRIRYWKNIYFFFWFHKPVKHLPRCYIIKFELCRQQLYYEDRGDSGLLNLFEKDLNNIDGYARDMTELRNKKILYPDD